MTTSTAFLDALHAEAHELTVQFPHWAARLAKAATAIELGRVWPSPLGYGTGRPDARLPGPHPLGGASGAWEPVGA